MSDAMRISEHAAPDPHQNRNAERELTVPDPRIAMPRDAQPGQGRPRPVGGHRLGRRRGNPPHGDRADSRASAAKPGGAGAPDNAPRCRRVLEVSRMGTSGPCRICADSPEIGALKMPWPICTTTWRSRRARPCARPNTKSNTGVRDESKLSVGNGSAPSTPQ